MPGHLNAQYHGEIEKMHFRELDRQIIKKKKKKTERGVRERGSWCEGESFICAAKRWQREKGMAKEKTRAQRKRRRGDRAKDEGRSGIRE